MKTILSLTFLAGLGLAHADPQLDSWYTAGSGKYARLVETDAQLASGATETTWSRTAGPNTTSQSLPVYAGPQQIDYSASYVYVRTPSLATYTMGPWYNNAAKSALFVNIPKNQGLLIQFPRTSIIGSIPTTKTQTAGYHFNGTLQDAIGFLADGVSIFDPTDGFAYNNGSESGPMGQWHRDAFVNEGITFDKSYAHQQNTGKYHHHADPVALRYQLGDNVTYDSSAKTYAEGDTSAPQKHSPIIGWMLDGLPVYGPYGYSSAMDATSGVRRMVGGFVLRDGTTAGVDNLNTSSRTLPAWALRNNGNQSAAGPNVSTTYPLGRYIEDWAYLGDLTKTGSAKYQQGTDFDLNEYNVRYCVTPEFPSGTWAYFLSINAAGTPQFPYMINRWFYATPRGGSITSITESVTNLFKGGANQPLAITSGPTLANNNVSLTWSTVEGGTYAVSASTDNSTWTSEAAGQTSTTGTKSAAYTALGSSGTEYARVQRTALASYDTTGTVTATVSQTATGSVQHPPSVSISTAAALPAGVVNVSYTQSFTAVNGTAPYTWSLTAGTLPDGLTLTDGTLSGTPTTAGAASFTLQVQDDGGLTASRAFTLTIAASAPDITAAALPQGIKAYAYSQALAETGGTAPFAWSVSSGTLPAGLSLSSAGVLGGKPTASGAFSFTVKVTDGNGLSDTQAFSLTILATYPVPVVNALSLGTMTVGQSFSYTVTATNTPKSFYVSGLPAGLRYVAATGVISGRPSVSGTFNVTAKAYNSGGWSAAATGQLIVQPFDPGFIGTFTGLVARDATANLNLGGRLSLTTTAAGTFTAKVTYGATTKSATGYLSASAPHVQVTLGSAALSLTLNSGSTASGTHGVAAVNAWRAVWNATTNKAVFQAGYYSVAMDLADAADDGVLTIPQGSGYAAITVTASGAVTLAGRTAGGQTLTTVGSMGPSGQALLYTSLYGNLGSICGTLTVGTPIAALMTANTVTGQVTWKKPATVTRTYAAGFGPLNLTASGMYLAAASTGHIIQGLPVAGTASLAFTDGGLDLAAIDPDVPAFTYSSTHVVTLPKAGTSANPGKATLAINASTGVINGGFTLVDGKLTRTAYYYGMIVRQPPSLVLAKGYFLLAQIPVTGQTSLTSPILSGGVRISQ